MEPSPEHMVLPDSDSLDLHLSHPTPDEHVTIWTNTSASWKDSFTLPVYLKESLYLTTIPLAKDGGMTTWVLVDKNLPPNQRPILCSCESFRKRSLISDVDGNVTDAIVHGIASVFCPPAFRRRGYAVRMMKELANVLHSWQSEEHRCIGSILYSDIGKEFYGKLGWIPNPTNSHVVFQPSTTAKQALAQPILAEDLAKFCDRDEVIIRKALATPAEVETRMSIIPDLDHMLWHISKEEFACEILFGEIPKAKGVVAGPPGSQMWAIWTHRYYGHPEPGSLENKTYTISKPEPPKNTLYILRLATEQPTSKSNFTEQAAYMKAIIQAAQTQAAKWKLDQVKLWDPSPSVMDMITQSGIEHVLVEREQESIASGRWYDANGEEGKAPQWINNEHYAWC